jgi:hypothetical protein
MSIMCMVDMRMVTGDRFAVKKKAKKLSNTPKINRKKRRRGEKYGIKIIDRDSPHSMV